MAQHQIQSLERRGRSLGAETEPVHARVDLDTAGTAARGPPFRQLGVSVQYRAQVRCPEPGSEPGQAAVQHIDGRAATERRAQPLALGGPRHEEGSRAFHDQSPGTGGGPEAIAVGLHHRMHGNTAGRFQRAEIRSKGVQVDGERGRCGHPAIYGDPLVRCNTR